MAEACPKCSAEKMIGAGYMETGVKHYGPFVRVDGAPNAALMTHPVSSRISAKICGSCGYIELYAQEPARLHEAWLRATGHTG